MIEMSPLRKNKINLSDYNYRRDIENRLLMATFSAFELEVFEEILYSSLMIPVRKLAKNLDVDEVRLVPILEKLKKTGLLTVEDDNIVVDKEMRKYYEAQMLKFDDEFKPGMEFLHNMLRKVPIPVLPVWYSIPRTSNNILDSLVEKFLLTPQIFQRYLLELNFNDPTLTGIIFDVYNSPDLRVNSKDLIDKYGLTKELFEEYMLHLEFNFVCCIGYTRQGEQWREIVTPFQEWRDYLIFLKDTECHSIEPASSIIRTRPQDFSFIQDMSHVLNLVKNQPIPLVSEGNGVWKLSPEGRALVLRRLEPVTGPNDMTEIYLDQVVAKLRLLKLADNVDGRLYALEAANDWLDMKLENRAHYLYRHPLNRILSIELPPYLCGEKSLREAEKCILRVIDKGWVDFEEFYKGVNVPLSEKSTVVLKKVGKAWKYAIPEYSEDERHLIEAVIYEWLFEIGVVATGTHQGKKCFCVTSFGQTLFSR